MLKMVEKYNYLKKDISMTKYGKKAGKYVKKAIEEYKAGTLKSGKSGDKVESRDQAIAIGLSEARKAGVKVPKKAESDTE